MTNKSTNIQDLFETLIKEKKKVILFGAGKGLRYYVDKINRYIWHLCDDWKTPSYISDESEYPYLYSGLEAFVDCIIDNDETKQCKSIRIGGGYFAVKSVEYLNKIDARNYIIIIVTDKYENEIKRQLQGIDHIKDVPCYSYSSDMHYYERYNRGLVVDRVIIPYLNSIEAYNFYEFPNDEYNKIKSLIEQGEYVANGVAFQITTICNLKCKYCADYVPRLSEHRNMDVDKILKDIDTFFRVTGRCLYVQLSTAEAVLCPNLDIILEKLLSMEEVQLIEIITNGLSYPKNEKVLRLLSNPKIIINMSNYNMPEKTDISRKFYKEHNINVRFFEYGLWKIEGTQPYDRKMNAKELSNCYMTCRQAWLCPQQIAEGRLTRCARIQRFVEVSDFDTQHDYIDFDKYQTDEELKQALIKLNLESYMDGCAWCAVPGQKASDFVPPAEQLS